MKYIITPIEDYVFHIKKERIKMRCIDLEGKIIKVENDLDKKNIGILTTININENIHDVNKVDNFEFEIFNRKTQTTILDEFYIYEILHKYNFLYNMKDFKLISFNKSEKYIFLYYEVILNE